MLIRVLTNRVQWLYLVICDLWLVLYCLYCCYTLTEAGQRQSRSDKIWMCKFSSE